MKHLSLEVVLGIVALAHLASRAMDVVLPIEWYIVVPLATWSLYTFDRIYDVRNKSNQPDTARHSFHLRHRRTLILLASAIGLIAAGIAMVTFPIWYWAVAGGLGLLLLVHARMQGYHSTTVSIVKDVNVAVTFTAAAWVIPAIIRLQSGVHADADAHLHSILHSAGVFVALLALVMTDVVLLSRLDVQSDASAGLPSIAVVLGTTKSSALITVLLIIATLLSAILWIESGSSSLFVDGHVRPAAILLGMCCLYSVFSYRAPRNPEYARLLFEGTLLLGFLA